MAHKTEWLTFYIVLTDPKVVKAQQDLHPYGVMMPPLDANATYGAPWKGYDDPNTGAPYSWTPWSGLNSKGGVYPLDVATFSRKSGGFWIFGGTTTTYHWLGKFTLAGNASNPGGVSSQGPISLRRWIEGFELPGMTPITAQAGLMPCRDAARHVGGLGLAFRGSTTAASTLSLNSYGYDPAAVVGGLVNGAHSWERFYLRLRRKPTTGTVLVWRTNGFPTSANGIGLQITTSGQIAVYAFDSGGSYLLGTAGSLEEWDPVLAPKAWHRIDCAIGYATPDAAHSFFTLYLDGFPIFQQTTNCPGLSGTGRHTSSQFGGPNSANDLEIDIDDWVCADIPYTILAGARQEVFTSKDFLAGSKIVAIRPKAFSSNHNAAGWPGDFRSLLQLPYSNNLVQLVSTTTSALAAVDSDDADMIDADKGQIGVAAVLVSAYSTRGTNSGTLGLTAGGVTTMINISQLGSPTAQQMLKSQVGTASDFADFTPIELRHAKGADTGSANLYALAAQAELIGVWGHEDLRFPNTLADQTALDAIKFPNPVGQHNAQYPHSPWALGADAAPLAPYIVKTGTYVGNNTGLDLAFRAPVNWLFVRPTTGGAGGYQWWSTMAASHKAFGEGIRPQLSHGVEDLTFVGSTSEQQQQNYVLRIGGNDSQINAVGITYQYIAVCDPGMRFMLNLALAHRQADTDDVNKLISALWRPEWAFMMLEGLSAATTVRLYGKGLGNAADLVAKFDGGTIASALTFGTGSITTHNGLHTINLPLVPISLWRRSDGNNDVGQPGVLALGSWVGDGSASRSVTTAPASGLRPLFALVFSESASGYWRDPSHTGSNSANSAGADVTTGITGGAVDGFTVGSSLNTNAVVYNYFVLLGSATAGNNGWSINGEFENADFYSPTDGPWPNAPSDTDPSLAPTFVTPAAADTLPLMAEDPDLDNVIDLAGTDLVCVDFTRKIVNQALARIGVSKQVLDLRTELSIEAVNARLTIKGDVERTLRDYPWPFATKYVKLPLVAGTAAAPVNADWIYSYRRPWDCMFERRLVLARGRAADPTPPPFAIGSDSGGGLIYCNVVAPVLEYTGRGICPTYEGDVLFREALIWRHAASLAPPLTRMPEKEKEALEAYERVLLKARLIIPPGKPGAAAPTIDVDTTAAHIAANVNVVNRALVRIGARPISSFTEQSREAVAALVIFEDELRSVLRDFAWPFATRYATPAVVGGTASVPLNNDWQYSYRMPDDVVAVRRLVTTTGRDYDPDPPRFRLSNDGTGGLLYTSETPATIEYTARVAGTVLASDALFRDALAWKLAAGLAPSVGQVDPDVQEQRGRGPETPERRAQANANALAAARERMQRFADAKYREALVKATVAAANEQQQPPAGDADWITGRN